MVQNAWYRHPDLGLLAASQLGREAERDQLHIEGVTHMWQQFVRMKLTTLLQKGLCDHLDSCVQQGNNFRKIGNSESIAYQNTKGDFQR
jgi:hypothetical protein